MKKIELTTSQLSTLEQCPNAYQLEHVKEVRHIGVMRDSRDEIELLSQAMERLLANPKEDIVSETVFDVMKENRIAYKPDMIKRTVSLLKKFVSKFNAEEDGKVLDVNKRFQLALGGVEITGILHRVNQINDELEVTIFKCENRAYTWDWLKQSYEPIIYGLVSSQLYDADKIRITYCMLKHDHSIYMETNRLDWEEQERLLEVAINNLINSKEGETRLGSHCPYCLNKNVCNDYKRYIMDSFEIRNINELVNIGLEEIIEFIQKLDNQKNILKSRSTELKNIVLNEMISNGVNRESVGQFELSILHKRKNIFDVNKVMEIIEPEDRSLVLSVLNKNMDHYLKGLPEDKRLEIMMNLSIQYYPPMLKITECPEVEIGDKKEEKKLRDLIGI